MYNVKNHEEILEYFKDDINQLNLRLKSLLFKEGSRVSDNGFLEYMENFLFLKAKRLRPVVIFLIWDMFKDFPGAAFNKEAYDDILNLALAVEILHSATLIHDDIVDMAKLRRGLAAFYLKFSPKAAVLAGDFLLSLAIKILSEINCGAVFKYFSNGVLKISAGELYQLFNKGKIPTVEEYLQKSRAKTGALFMLGAKCTFELIEKRLPDNERAVLLKNRDEILKAVDNFSLGFQIYDDIENFSGSDIQKLSSDIENEIYTLPYLYLSHKNLLCDNITDEIKKQAVNYSNQYLNGILDEGINCLLNVKECKTNLMIKLIETFKN